MHKRETDKSDMRHRYKIDEKSAAQAMYPKANGRMPAPKSKKW